MTGNGDYMLYDDVQSVKNLFVPGENCNNSLTEGLSSVTIMKI